MSRTPGPRLLRQAMQDGIHTLEVIDTPCQWAVTYRGQLCGLIKQHLVSVPKYPRTIFQTAKPAINLARKLNRIFQTEDFGVAALRIDNSSEENSMGRTRALPPADGGHYQVNLPRMSPGTRGEVLENGHIRYDRGDGTEIIRINSRAYPTDNIRKYAGKKQEK